MFETLEDRAKKSPLRPRSWTRLVGGAVVVLIIFSLIMAPKLWPQRLRQVVALVQGPIYAPSLPKQPPPPEHKQVVKLARHFTPPDDGRFHAPPNIPPVVDLTPEPPSEAPPAVNTCVNCNVIQLTGNPAPPSIVLAPPEPPPAPPPPPQVVEVKSVTPQRVRIGGSVQAANLIKKVAPAYPALAKQVRVQGTVHFTALIGKDGTIQNLQLVSGHPLLVQAATAAVSQWVYRPTLLNGEPVEVVTQIDVTFTLTQ